MDGEFEIPLDKALRIADAVRHRLDGTSQAFATLADKVRELQISNDELEQKDSELRSEIAFLRNGGKVNGKNG